MLTSVKISASQYNKHLWPNFETVACSLQAHRCTNLASGFEYCAPLSVCYLNVAEASVKHSLHPVIAFFFFLKTVSYKKGLSGYQSRS